MVLKVAVSPDLIGGDVDEGYGKVADAFHANFTAGRKVGAAVAVYRDGVKVVDLWGGYRDGIVKAPWQHDYPDTGIGFGYVMNRMGFHLCSDPRELALRQALSATCLAHGRRSSERVKARSPNRRPQ
jgi:hypothetical protein